MRVSFGRLGIALATLALAATTTPLLLAGGKVETFTGEVGDAMCGVKHEMAGSHAECTRECIQHGSKYALISGDKVYTLETSDKAALDQLDKLAGQKATIKGTAEGTTIQVSAVSAAK